ncbi:MAG: sulfate transporter, periplasmic sulfate-binding protein [Thermoleophilia bacterium]|nr:sulfate transporter, periplasmic sulfate-binding protein [Thermoleophilia bacterium]
MPRPARTAVRATAALALAGLVAAGCGSDGGSDSDSSKGSADAPNSGAKLTLVAYSTPREAFEEIIPKFTKTKAGSGVEFEQSYGASGDQSRAVEGGLAADVVDLSLEPDVTRLVDANIVDSGWNENEHKGIVSDSVVVLVVRKGNPKKITGWDDLLGKDVDVVTPNPFTSGGARWNLMAAYGAWTRDGTSPKEALDNLETLLRNTVVQSASAREALQVFSQGKGDVLISYENEAITAKAKGQDVEYVIPDKTILIENPGAVTSTSKSPKAAQAFLDYLWTDEAQRVFGKKGYRPVTKSVYDEFDFEEPKDEFTIEDLGGWKSVMDEFFDRENGKVAKIEQGLGVGTDG